LSKEARVYVLRINDLGGERMNYPAINWAELLKVGGIGIGSGAEI